MTITVSHPHSGDLTNVPFASKLADARKNCGYTVEQLAITCGLTMQEITALEDGSDINPSHIQRVASALQIPLSTVI